MQWGVKLIEGQNLPQGLKQEQQVEMGGELAQLWVAV